MTAETPVSAAQVMQAAETLVKHQDALLVAYRLGRRPTAKTLDGIGPARRHLEELKRRLDEQQGGAA